MRKVRDCCSFEVIDHPPLAITVVWERSSLRDFFPRSLAADLGLELLQFLIALWHPSSILFNELRVPFAAENPMTDFSVVKYELAELAPVLHNNVAAHCSLVLNFSNCAISSSTRSSTVCRCSRTASS